MRENNLRKIIAEGGKVANAWLAIPSSISAEVVAHCGFPSVTVDMQHGMVELQAAFSMFQAISTTDAVPMARVNWNDPAMIMKALDAGAYGIICPMVNNREQAEAFVGACRYAPEGYRSIGAPRGALYGGSDYYAKANETILALAMIETREAMGNLDEIMSTPTLDGIYIGPNDLARSLGYDAYPDPKEPEVIEAVDTILATAKKHNLIACIHTTGGEMSNRYFEKGFDLCTLMNEVGLMAKMCRAEIKVAHGE